LFVCHANLCRSPLAERLTRHAFEEAFGAGEVFISSAGTHAYEGSAMHPGSAAVLSERGVEAAGFTTRTLNAAIVATADLVLTAEREQRAACVKLAPGAVRRAFTVRQFARLAGAVPPAAERPATVPGRLHSLVEQVNAKRHLVSAAAPGADDLADPVGQPIEAFRECAREVWRSAGVIVGIIAAP
jgi:protein-tyrosine phosphatase